MNGIIVKMFKDFGGEVVDLKVFPDLRIENDTWPEPSQETMDAVDAEIGRTKYPTQLLILRSLEIKGWEARPVRTWEEVEDARDLASK